MFLSMSLHYAPVALIGALPVWNTNINFAVTLLHIHNGCSLKIMPLACIWIRGADVDSLKQSYLLNKAQCWIYAYLVEPCTPPPVTSWLWHATSLFASTFFFIMSGASGSVESGFLCLSLTMSICEMHYIRGLSLCRIFTRYFILTIYSRKCVCSGQDMV